MDNININANVNNYFDNISFSSKYNFDIFITFILFLITFLIILKFLLSNYFKVSKNDWEKNKCNPIYMPFGKDITNNKDELFNVKNMNKCINENLYEVSHSFFEPIKSSLVHIMGFFSFLGLLFSKIIGFFGWIFKFVKFIFTIILEYIKKIGKSIENVFNNIINLFNEFMNILETFVLTIRLVIDTMLGAISLIAISWFLGACVPTILMISLAVILIFIGIILVKFFFTAIPGAILIGTGVVSLIISIILLVLFLIIMFKMQDFTIQFNKGLDGDYN